MGRSGVEKAVEAILLDPEKQWRDGRLGPTGGWVALLSCAHRLEGADLNQRPRVGDSVLCLACKREMSKLTG